MTNTIGQRIRKGRERLGITQTKLAELSSLTPASISQYESGKRRPHSYTIPRLAKALNVTSDYLVGNLTYSEKDMLANPNVRKIIEIFSDLPAEEQNVIYQFILFLGKSYSDKKQSG